MMPRCICCHRPRPHRYHLEAPEWGDLTIDACTEACAREWWRSTLGPFGLPDGARVRRLEAA